MRLNEQKQVVFANPIYQEIVPRVLTANFQHAMVGDDIYHTPWYVLPNGDLDMDKLFREFQAFYREHSESWLQRFDYAEAGQQLLLMAFLQRIINGGGRIEREMATGNGRSDLVIFWQNQVLPIELKLKRNEQTLSKGLFQLNRYLDKLGTSHGYLVLFELKNSDIVPWDTRLKMYDMAYEGKRITVVEL